MARVTVEKELDIKLLICNFSRTFIGVILVASLIMVACGLLQGYFPEVSVVKDLMVVSVVAGICLGGIGCYLDISTPDD
ncbi:hypothetical protein [Vibrio phage vB_VpaP_SJSY21]|nr:hypothetical protein [Vibrio phage vB_VpaP_SJSY21]